MVLPERSQERLCKLISHHHAADQVVEADRKIKERCIGVVTRKKSESPRRIESQTFRFRVTTEAFLLGRRELCRK